MSSYSSETLPIPLADAMIIISGQENILENTRHEYSLIDAQRGA